MRLKYEPYEQESASKRSMEDSWNGALSDEVFLSSLLLSSLELSDTHVYEP